VLSRDSTPFAPEVHIGFKQTALGDCVATLPAIRFALKNYPSTTFNIWAPDYMADLVDRCFGAVPNARVYKASEIASRADVSLPAALNKFEGDGRHTTLKTRIDNYAFRAIVDMDPPEPKDAAYLQLTPRPEDMPPGLPQKYLVLTLGHTSDTRRMLPDLAQSITDHAGALGLPTVLLGTSKVSTGSGDLDVTQPAAPTGEVIDLRDWTSLLQAHAIMAGARVVVGIDNGLLHLAAMSEVPIIAGYTNVDPATRIPIRPGGYGWRYQAITPSVRPACVPCQSKWHFCYDVQFTKCFYKDYACLNFDHGHFISAIDNAVCGDSLDT